MLSDLIETIYKSQDIIAFENISNEIKDNSLIENYTFLPTQDEELQLRWIKCIHKIWISNTNQGLGDIPFLRISIENNFMEGVKLVEKTGRIMNISYNINSIIVSHMKGNLEMIDYILDKISSKEDIKVVFNCAFHTKYLPLIDKLQAKRSLFMTKKEIFNQNISYLQLSCNLEDEALINYFLSIGTKITCNILESVIIHKNYNLFLQLIRQVTNIKAYSKKLLAVCNDSKMFELLVENGAKFSLIKYLHYYCKKGNLDLMKCIMSRVYVPVQDLRKLMDYAARKYYAHIIEYFLYIGGKIHDKMLLHYVFYNAMLEQNISLLETLIRFERIGIEYHDHYFIRQSVSTGRLISLKCLLKHVKDENIKLKYLSLVENI